MLAPMLSVESMHHWVMLQRWQVTATIVLTREGLLSYTPTAALLLLLGWGEHHPACVRTCRIRCPAQSPEGSSHERSALGRQTAQ